MAEAEKKRKKLLTNGLGFANIIFALKRAADVSKETKNKLKKLLTSKNAYDKIYELSLRQQRTLKTEQYVKP